MASLDVKVTDNSDEFKSALASAKAVALEQIGLVAERYAKELCPTDTGRLKNSISHATDGDNEYIGTNVEYAPYVELGHHQEVGRYVPAIGKRLVREYVPPKPFLKPAAEEHASEYRSILESKLKGE